MKSNKPTAHDESNMLINDLLEHIEKNKNNFELGEFEGDVFWLSHLSFLQASLNYGFFHMTVYYNEKKYLSCYDKALFEKVGKELFEKYKSNPGKLRNEFYSSKAKLIASVNNLNDSSSISIHDYDIFISACSDFGGLSLFSLESLEYFLQKQIISAINDSKLLELLTAPLYTAYVTEQNNALFKLLSKLPKNELEMIKKREKNINKYNSLKKLFAKHIKDWWWAFSNYASQEYISDQELLYYSIKNYPGLEQESKKYKQSAIEKKKKNQMMNKLAPEIRNLIEFFDLVVELRDQRKIGWLMMLMPAKKWLKKISAELNEDYYDLLWLTKEEIMKLIAKKEERQKLLAVAMERRKGCTAVYGFKNNPYILFIGDDYKKILFALLKRDKKQELKGLAASKGKTTGKVRNIYDTKDFASFKQGEILVASHTTPDYLVIMKKAKAIITERGGITSHAAIISRELGIPCIVGITGLMNNFKDGDLVEVDANKGIVRKIR